MCWSPSSHAVILLAWQKATCEKCFKSKICIFLKFENMFFFVNEITVSKRFNSNCWLFFYHSNEVICVPHLHLCFKRVILSPTTSLTTDTFKGEFTFVGKAYFIKKKLYKAFTILINRLYPQNHITRIYWTSYWTNI